MALDADWKSAVFFADDPSTERDKLRRTMLGRENEGVFLEETMKSRRPTAASNGSRVPDENAFSQSIGDWLGFDTTHLARDARDPRGIGESFESD